MDYLLIVIGFFLLIVGANFLVDGSVGLARRFKVSDLVIGLTIVAFGTSAPELVVNLVAALSGQTDIALTNIIGSNMINTYVILGATALFYPVKSQLSSRRFDIPLNILGPLLLFALAWFDSSLSRIDGLVLLAFFILFMYRTVRKTKTIKEVPDVDVAEQPQKAKSIWGAVSLILGGLVMLVLGGQLIVKSATNIAESLGISQAIIGLTIVALGTSLPELATSVVAAIKKNSDIALGNVVGSNIFNIFFVLACSATIRPLPAYLTWMIRNVIG